jgi:hypothetical protein
MKCVSSILLFTLWSGLWGQYANVVNITNDRFEYTYNFHVIDDELWSNGFVSDTTLQLFGFNHLEIKKYDDEFNVEKQILYSDSIHQYTSYYGAEYLQGKIYLSGTKNIYQNWDTLKGYIVKIDTSGNIAWEKIYFTNNKEVRINYTAQKDTIVYGLANITNPSIQKTKIFSIDSSGNVIQEKDFQGYSQQPISLRTTSDNGFIVSTTGVYYLGAKNPIVYKLDSNLNIKWQKVLGPPDRNHALQFFELPNGNYLGVGSSEEPATGYSRAWLVELDSANGQVLIDTVYWFADRYSLFNVYSNIIYEEDGLILISSRSANPIGSNPPYHSLIIKMDYNYSIMWSREYYHSEYANPLYNMYEKDNFYHFQGLVFQDSPTNTHDEWFLVVDSLGCDDQFCSVGINPMSQFENDDNLKIFPNPAQNEIYIEIKDKENPYQNYSYQILDVSGKLVSSGTTLANHPINISNFPNGYYLIRITNEDNYISKPLIINR